MADFPDFSPGALGVQPLPMPAPVAPTQPVPPAPGKKPSVLSQLGPLLALLPIAMARGGAPAVAGLLNGYQASIGINRDRSRQDRLDAQTLQEKQAAEKDRQNTESDRRLQTRTAFLGQAQKGLDNIDNPDQLSQYTDYLTTAGQPYGVTAQDAQRITASLTPSKLQTKAAQKKLDQIDKTYSDTERQRAEAGGALFTIGDEKLTLPQLRARAGGGIVDAQGNPAPVPPAEKPPTVPPRTTNADIALDTWAREHVNPATQKPYAGFADLPSKLQRQAQAEAYRPPSAALVLQNTVDAQTKNQPPIDASRPTGAAANVADPITGLTPNATYQLALDYALTQKIPSQGLGGSPRAQAVRAQIPNKAAAIASAAGVDLPTVQAEYRANAGTLAKLLPQAQATANASNTASDNLDLALQQSAQVSRSGSKLANRYLQWAQGNLTPAQGLTEFETYIYTAAREYAKVTGGGAANSSGLTDSAQREASQLLNAAQSPEAFATAVQAMKNDMKNVVSEQAKGIGRVSNTIGNFFAAANGVDATGAAPTTTNRPTPPGANPFRR